MESCLVNCNGCLNKIHPIGYSGVVLFSTLIISSIVWKSFNTTLFTLHTLFLVVGAPWPSGLEYINS